LAVQKLPGSGGTFIEPESPIERGQRARGIPTAPALLK
jgi:hypothetical protein